MAPADGTPPPSPALLSQAEAAAACGVSEATIRRARKAGRIHGVQTDPAGGYRIPVSSLLAAGFTLDRVTRDAPVSPSGTPTPSPPVTPEPAPVEDDLREQLRAATARAEDAERRAAIAEAIAAERARSLEDMRLTLRALTAAPAPAPTPAPTPTPAPAVDDDGRAAAAWAEHPNRTIRPDTTIHRGTAARDATAALLADVLTDDPATAAQVATARAAGQPTAPATPGPAPSPQPRWRRLLTRARR